MDWQYRMTCGYCHRLIAEHPWPGGFHREMVGVTTDDPRAYRKRRR